MSGNCHLIEFVVDPLLPGKVRDKGKSAFSNEGAENGNDKLSRSAGE
jgi:hypothetical protein